MGKDSAMFIEASVFVTCLDSVCGKTRPCFSRLLVFAMPSNLVERKDDDLIGCRPVSLK